MKLRIDGIPTEDCVRIWEGGLDANGQPALTRIAQGPANPCRHCLQRIAAGEEKLVLAYLPFHGLQPYAESGPIFLHAKPCDPYRSDAVPGWFAFLDPALVRGYDRDDWIRYETGAVVRGSEITKACEEILGDPEIAYVHVRSKFNCFQCRVDRDRGMSRDGSTSRIRNPHDAIEAPSKSTRRRSKSCEDPSSQP